MNTPRYDINPRNFWLWFDGVSLLILMAMITVTIYLAPARAGQIEVDIQNEIDLVDEANCNALHDKAFANCWRLLYQQRENGNIGTPHLQETWPFYIGGVNVGGFIVRGKSCPPGSVEGEHIVCSDETICGERQ